MVALDALMVTAALPVMGRDLHAGMTASQWTVDAHARPTRPDETSPEPATAPISELAGRK